MLADVDLYNWNENPLESVGWGVGGAGGTISCMSIYSYAFPIILRQH